MDHQDPYVVCWSVGRQHLFVATDDWPTARARFETQVLRQSPTADLTEFARRYLELNQIGNGILPGRRLPVGIIRPHRARGRESFALLRFAGQFLSALDTAAGIDALLADISRRGINAVTVRYRPETEADRASARQPPSEMRTSLNAQLALRRLLNAEPSSETLAELSRGELLWLGNELREHRRPDLALAVADRAQQMSPTVGVLNLMGATLRDEGAYRASEASYRESLDLCASAEFNPFGHVGLAATLRRLQRQDEAYIHVKKALKEYPDNRHALETRDAILRDMDIGPGKSRARAA